MKEYFKSGFTPCHIAAINGHFDLMWLLIDRYRIDIDDLSIEDSQATLLHVIAKYRLKPFSESDKITVLRLINQTNNYLAKSPLGRRNFVEVAKIFDNENCEFMESSLFTSIDRRERSLLFYRLAAFR